MLFNRGRTAIDREFRELNAKEGLLSDPRIPDLPVFPHVPVVDSFAFAAETVPDAQVSFDRRQFVAGASRTSACKPKTSGAKPCGD